MWYIEKIFFLFFLLNIRFNLCVCAQICVGVIGERVGERVEDCEWQGVEEVEEGFEFGDKI